MFSFVIFDDCILTILSHFCNCGKQTDLLIHSLVFESFKFKIYYLLFSILLLDLLRVYRKYIFRRNFRLIPIISEAVEFEVLLIIHNSNMVLYYLSCSSTFPLLRFCSILYICKLF